MRAWVHVALGVVLLGCGDSGNEPVEITTGNLDGYWLSTTEGGSTWPLMLHFGPELHPSEVVPGVTQYVETMNLTSSVDLMTYTLTGKEIALSAPGQMAEAYFHIESLTANELVARVGGVTTTFSRMPGCAGPSLWGGSSLNSILSAEWDKFGGLHVLTTGTFQSGYAWVAPGRCHPTFPSPLTVVGEALDVTDDGDIRILDYQRDGGLPGEIIVTTVPAKPWERVDLDPKDVIVPAPNCPTAQAPPMRSVELGDGRFMVLYAYLDLYAVTVDGTTTDEVSSSLYLNSAFTPLRLEVDHMPDGAILVRAGENERGALYKDGTWSEWSRIDQASVFAYDGDTLYGAWTEGVLPQLVIGRRKNDGTWDTIAAGRGFAARMRVADDGAIDVIGPLDAQGLGPMVWTHVPPGFAKNTWHQEFHLDAGGGIDAVLPRPAWGGRFGPNGEVFMAMDHGKFRRPHLERGELRRALDVTIRFDTETDAAIVLPTLGERCEEECHVWVPAGSIVPAVLEVPGESAATRLIEGWPTQDGWSYYAPAPGPATIGYEMRVETRVRRMTDVIALGEDNYTTMGDIVVTEAGYAVTWGGSGVNLGLVEDGVVVAETVFNAILTDDQTLLARPDGGFVLALGTLPTSNTPGVVILDPSLEVSEEVPFDPETRRYAVTADGYIGLRYASDSADMEIYSQASPPTKIAIREPDTIRASGDGVIAFSARDWDMNDGSPGNTPAWRKLGLDGQVEWTLESSQARVVWNVVEGDLVIAATIGTSLTLGGATYQDAGRTFIGRFDGATGTLEQHALVEVFSPNGGTLTSVTADTDGVLLAANSTTYVSFVHAPWSGAGRSIAYLSESIGGYCVQNPCRDEPVEVVALGGGRYAAQWSQTQPTYYDGAPVLSPQRRSVTGVYTPEP